MKKFFSVFLILTVLLSPSRTSSQPNQIVIASERWDDATEKDGSGLYWDIMRLVYESESIEVKWQIKTYSAAVKHVLLEKADAVLGAYKDEIDGVIYPDMHFAVDIVNVLTVKANNVKWRGERSLINTKVGWIKGYSFDDYLSVPVRKIEIYDRVTAMRIIRRGRIDFYIDAAADLADYFKHHEQEKAFFDQWVLKELKVYIAFRNDKTGQELADIFDKQFKQLLNNGTINALYNNYIIQQGANFTNPFE